MKIKINIKKYIEHIPPNIDFYFSSLFIIKLTPVPKISNSMIESLNFL